MADVEANERRCFKPLLGMRRSHEGVDLFESRGISTQNYVHST
eukprot:CAMPEP_0195293100 /NCGR_PEP_ID=MMETSP0707-20130614/11672_1 /TAXON_ID=33640 /ORGANISM="Asterionellopsis glacialis, Strain CCMP134" /LENGTH=42 /DNA_ID= /DNA_START= /DNA_END= /DNA_ORIENTATION=